MMITGLIFVGVFGLAGLIVYLLATKKDDDNNSGCGCDAASH